MTAPERPIGRQQATVLTVLWVRFPQSVPVAVLAYLGDAEGDMTRGRRVLEILKRRGLVILDGPAPLRPNDLRTRYTITGEGRMVLRRWLARVGLDVGADF